MNLALLIVLAVLVAILTPPVVAPSPPKHPNPTSPYAATSQASPSSSTLTLFAYSEHSPVARDNAIYFLTYGVPSSSTITTILIINGPHTLHDTLNPLLTNPNFHVLERPNDCFDFGAWAAGIQHIRDRRPPNIPPVTPLPFLYYIFLNSSVKGPIGRYDTDYSTWHDEFTRHISDTTKLVGTTFNCHFGPSSWHLQSMSLCTDSIGFETVFKKYLPPPSIACFPEKVDAIYGGEIPLSQEFLNAGHAIHALSKTMFAVPVSLTTTATVLSICAAIKPLTTMELGDTYHSPHPLVYPHEVTFFKTNVPTTQLRPSVMSATHAADGSSSLPTPPRCRVAFTFTGGMRSFDDPAVHTSIAANLIEGMSEGCERFFFGYLDGALKHPASSDSVGLEYLRKFFDADKFVVQYHDESLYATPPANHCPNNLPPASTFSQFYKLRAVSRMVQQYEFETGARMEWVVRGRPDVAWLTRPVSVTRFEKGAVYVPQANFWPVNDQVAIVPRELMDLYYDGVDDYFKCSDAAWFPEGVGSPDCLLWRRIMTANVVMYDFDAVIVRSGNAGARCDSLTKGKNVACQVVKGFTDQLGEGLCEDMFSARLQASCVARFKVVSGEDLERSKEMRMSMWMRAATSPYTNVSWWEGSLATYGISETAFVGGDNDWYPLVVAEEITNLQSAGAVLWGFAVSGRMIKSVEKELKGVARGGSGEELHDAMMALWKGAVGPVMCEADGCGEEVREHIQQLIGQRANELAN